VSYRDTLNLPGGEILKRRERQLEARLKRPFTGAEAQANARFGVSRGSASGYFLSNPPCAGCALGFNFGSAKECNLRGGFISHSGFPAAEEFGYRGFAGFAADLGREALVRKGILAGDEAEALSGWLLKHTIF